MRVDASCFVFLCGALCWCVMFLCWCVVLFFYMCCVPVRADVCWLGLLAIGLFRVVLLCVLSCCLVLC